MQGLELRRCSAVVVSFAHDISAARQWLAETGCQWRFVQDAGRRLYSSLGLGREVCAVWSLSSVRYYAQMLRAGRQLPTSLMKDDDPYQMGGDFLVASDGQLLLAYSSKTPQDRPSVEVIFAALDK